MPPAKKAKQDDGQTCKTPIISNIPEMSNRTDNKSVDRILHDQVDKVAALLTCPESDVKLRVATVCSGTESPIIALQLIQEQARKHGIDVDFEHVQSCENAPFKSSYIRRNFPSVPVFRDVVQLGDAAESGMKATTMLGSCINIPDADVLVAGTSCKDFSSLKKADLDESGTSANTFFATVKLIHAKQYPVVLLENVMRAEWEAMASYITGRLPIDKKRKVGKGDEDEEDEDEEKDACGSNPKPRLKCKKAKTVDDVVFQLDKDELIVYSTPSWAGIRVESLLLGFSIGGAGQEPNCRVHKIDTSTLGLEDGDTISMSVLISKLDIVRSGTHMIFDVPVQYQSQLITVDSKNFGLPQTRMRRYMLLWRADKYDFKHAGKIWQELVKHLETSITSTYDDFLLPETDPAIRRFREALRSSMGRRQGFLRQRGNWWTSSSKDVGKHQDFRAAKTSIVKSFRLSNPMEELARPCTRWSSNGKICLASHKWLPESLQVFFQRELDLLDCAMAKNAQCGNDFLFQPTSIDTSQNIHRTSLVPYKPGVVGCITPGGNIFLTHLGRPILGREKMLLSGIPTDRLLLGPESEVELSDLAGNAMSCPVVGACLLAMICIPARQTCPSSSLNSFKRRVANVPKAVPQIQTFSEGTDCIQEDDWMTNLESMQKNAFSTSILCTCETSGAVSGHAILMCKTCHLTVCSKCAVQLQTETHSIDVTLTPTTREISPSFFEHQLWQNAPSILVIKDNAAVNTELYLVEVQRQRGMWELKYKSRCAIASTICVKLDRNGVSAVARLGNGRQYERHPRSKQWNQRCSGQTIEDVAMTALNDANHPRTPTYAAECGMKADASGALDTWPGVIQVECDAEVFSGLYVRSTCRNTRPFGVLYTKSTSTSTSTSLTISSATYQEPCKLQFFDQTTAETWNVLTTDTDSTPLSFLSSLTTGIVRRVTLVSENSVITKLPERFTAITVLEKKSNSEAEWKDFKCTITHVNTKFMLSQTKMSDVDGKTKFSVRLKYGRTLFTTSAMNLLSAPMNSMRIPSSFKWITAGRAYDDSSTPVRWGDDVEITCPPPKEEWQLKSGVYLRVVDPEEATNHERRLAVQCKPWKISANVGLDEDVVITARPFESLHRVAFMLRYQGLGAHVNPDDVVVKWRMLTSQTNFVKQMEERATIGFSVGKSISSHDEVDRQLQPECFTTQLYDRQLLMLKWMLNVESGNVSFVQSEFLSDSFFSTIPWTLQAKACCKSPLSGGMVCDSMGGGKTVITLALVALDKQNRDSSMDSKMHFASQLKDLTSRATLVVAPRHTVKSVWRQLAKTFAPNLKVVTIVCASDLRHQTLQTLVESDLVVVAQDLLVAQKEDNGDDYSKLLTKFADEAANLPPLLHGKNRTRRIGLVGDAIVGVYIPHVAQQPYGSSETRQSDREGAAYFSYRYQTAISRSRRKLEELAKSESDLSVLQNMRGVPIEAISWNRLVLDEIQNGFDSGSGCSDSEKTQAAIRELVGVGVDNSDARPLRSRGCVWGLSGTPILTQHRVIEYASICSNVHVAGAATHWRLLERASVRDATLYAMRRVQEPCDTVEEMTACQSYLNQATQCLYEYDEKLEGVELCPTIRIARIKDESNSTYLKCLHDLEFKHSTTPSPYDLAETAFQDIMEASACDPARMSALKKCILQVEKRRRETNEKLVVVTPLYAHAAARAALDACNIAYVDSSSNSTDDVAAFAANEKTANQESDPWILLLDEQNITGLNLQHVSRCVCFFAPIFKNVPAEAAAIEKQSIARVYRPGQQAGNVYIVHIIISVDDTGKTFDQQIYEQNTSIESVRAATGFSK